MSELQCQVARWLGKKTVHKERLVQLLVARMTWDWESYNKLLGKTPYKDLENQVIRMDICHYDFPAHLNKVIKSIGQLQPAKDFEGCGSYNSDILKVLEKEFLELNKKLQSFSLGKTPEKNTRYKMWLIACFAKTIKQYVGWEYKIEGLHAIK